MSGGCVPFESVVRGDYVYGSTDGSIILINDLGGHFLATIHANDGDWERILNEGADPVRDGWEDGNGYTVAEAVSIVHLITRIVDCMREEHKLIVSRDTVEAYIYDTNEHTQSPYNDTADDHDVHDLCDWLECTSVDFEGVE